MISIQEAIAKEVESNSFSDLEIIELDIPVEEKTEQKEIKIWHNLNFYALSEDLKKDDRPRLSFEQKKVMDSDEPRELDQGKDPSSIILSGETGIGKTIQAIKVMKDYILKFYQNNKEIIDNNYNYLHWNTPVFVDQSRVLQLLQYSKSGNEQQKTIAFYELQEIKSCYFLVFDELSCAKTGASWTDNDIDKLLKDIFQARYEMGDQITIITTNDTLEQMKDPTYSLLSFDQNGKSKTLSRILGCCKRYARSNKTVDLRLKDITNNQ